MISVHLDKVAKRFGYRYIFKNLSFKFSDGIYGISGKNGSGKSTLLKVISGFMSYTDGHISYSFDSQQIKRSNIYQKVSVAAPYVNLIDEFTLPEIFSFHQDHKRLDCNGYDDFLEILDYPYRPDTFWKEYSSGMQQRVKLGLALLGDASLLILDEPTSFLDDKASDWFYSLLSQKNNGRLILIGSNDKRDFLQCRSIINIEDYH